MSIFRRVSFLGFALVSLVVLAACGGDGDGNGGEAFELPPPGEYSFEVTGTMEIEFLEEAVSAAPLALGAPQTVDYEGSLRIKLGEGGSFTISDKNGVRLVAGKEVAGAEGGAFPITFTQNEEMESSGTISNAGVTIELNVLAELGDGVTATHQQPIILEGPDNPFSDEGATLSMPLDAEPVNFGLLGDVDPRIAFGITAVFMSLFGGFGLEETDEPPPDEDAELPTDTEEQGAEFTDAEGDTTECTFGAPVDDADVDILSVNVTQLLDGVEVRVELRASPPEGEEWFSSSVQLKIGQQGRIQLGQREDHAGEPNTGRIDEAGQVIPGSEGDVVAEGKFVTFSFPSLVLQEGDTVSARSFHQKKAEDDVHCDVTDEFPLDELVLP